MADDKNQTPLQSACPICEKATDFCSCSVVTDNAPGPTGQWIKNLASFAGAALTPQPIEQTTAVTSQSHVGSVINDRYELLELLGQGGMGSVFKAKRLMLERQFALKILKCTASDSQDSRARFEREAKTAARLSHPSLVSVYDYGTTADGEEFIVMDFIAGKSLAEIVSVTGPLETKRAIHIFSQIVDGLAHAHAHGVIHRDLKPSNVMILAGEKGIDSVKIVDFGIAKIVGDQGDTTPALTKTGEVFGSPMYMSPEQCRGQIPDHRSDIYSLGCLMYECLIGQPVFTADNSLALIFKHIHEAPAAFDSSSGRNLVPSSLAGVVLKALAKSPDGRYQSMEDLREALNEADLSPPPPSAASASLLGSKWISIAVGVILLLFASIGIVFYYANLPPSRSVPQQTASPTTITPTESAHIGTKDDQPIASPQPEATQQDTKEKSRASEREKHRSQHPRSAAAKSKPTKQWPHKLESKLKSFLRKL
jgi:serine/threonine protein kinase